MRRRLLIGLIAVASATYGCGGDDDPAGPTTVLVEGRVISSRSKAAISGATVGIGNLIGADFVSTTTDADGRFAASVEVFECGGVHILATQTGYVQPAPYPDLCPGSSRTIELNPDPTSSVITPDNPTIQLNGTVEFHVRVTFFDGTVEDDGEAVWLIAADSDIADSSTCGMIPDVGVVRGTTYTAPASLPPTECGAEAGQAAVVAAPIGGDGFGNLAGSDTVVVTVTP
jgi:hypothetical protein